MLDKQGNPLPKAELARMQGIRDAALDVLGKLQFNQQDSANANRLGLNKALVGQVAKEPVDLKISIDRSLAAIPAKIDAVFKNYVATLNVDIKGLETALGRPITNQADLVEGYKA